MLKSFNRVTWEKFQEKLSLPVNKLQVPTHKIWHVVNLRQKVLDCLLYNIVEGIKVLMIDGLCLLGKVELIFAVNIIKAFFHKKLAHWVAIRHEEIMVNMGSLAITFYKFQIDFL